jgi:hypothetical protein
MRLPSGTPEFADAPTIRHFFVDDWAPEILTQDLRPMKISTARPLFRYEQPRWKRARTPKLDKIV